MRRAKTTVCSSMSLLVNSSNTLYRCKNCIRLNLECKQPDLFQPSTFTYSQVRNADCRVPISKLTSRTDPSFDTSLSPLADLDEYFESHVDDADFEFLSTNVITKDLTPHKPTGKFPFMREMLFFPQASTLEHGLLQHYTDSLSNFLVNFDCPSNPLRSVVLPRAAASPVLMNAVYATSSLHIFACNHVSLYHVAAMEYYSKAASSIYTLIENFGTYTNNVDQESILLTIVFLCKYEILSGGVSNWRWHLQGLQNLLRALPGNSTTLSQEIMSLVQSL